MLYLGPWASLVDVSVAIRMTPRGQRRTNVKEVLVVLSSFLLRPVEERQQEYTWLLISMSVHLLMPWQDVPHDEDQATR